MISMAFCAFVASEVKEPAAGVPKPIFPGVAHEVAGSTVLVHVVPLEVRTFPLVLGATVSGAPVPLPRRTLLVASVVEPVPPLATATTPVTLPAVVAVVALPLKFAVMVPAAKLLALSRITMAEAVFAAVAAFAKSSAP